MYWLLLHHHVDNCIRMLQVLDHFLSMIWDAVELFDHHDIMGFPSKANMQPNLRWIISVNDIPYPYKNIQFKLHKRTDKGSQRIIHNVNQQPKIRLSGVRRPVVWCGQADFYIPLEILNFITQNLSYFILRSFEIKKAGILVGLVVLCFTWFEHEKIRWIR